MNKKEPADNDSTYPILSVLLDGPEELAVRAEALRNSIIHDMTDSSHPKLRQLEVISDLLRTNYIDSGRPYQHALQQVGLSDLRQLLEASEQEDDRTQLITAIEQIQWVANQISFTVDLSQEHTDGSVSWTEAASLKSTITLDAPVQQTEEIEPNLSDYEMISRLDAMGYRVINTAIDQVYYAGGTLSINGRLVLEIKPTGVDGRFLGLFFRGPKNLKKRNYQLGDVVELLKDKEDNPSLNTRQLQKRYSDARIRINRKVKAEAGISELIRYKDRTFFVNQDLL